MKFPDIIYLTDELGKRTWSEDQQTPEDGRYILTNDIRLPFGLYIEKTFTFRKKKKNRIFKIKEKSYG